LAFLIFAAGLWMGALVDDFWDKDACLDHGGAWRGWYCELDATQNS